ncbi:toll/interleukin-1 receptor domain-containing protein [Nocardia brasiliensis]|uniref:toll/interleukin-1 receptor domain-containing protein n=1 Tax=Nocardia brasiliensis TaxID=37326 RepID=UPI00366B92A7
MIESIGYGPVVVKKPKRGMRIGYYDDDHHTGRGERAIVYYCEPPLVFTNKYEIVHPKYLAPIDTDSLWTRREALQSVMAQAAYSGVADHRELYDLSLEYSLVNALLVGRLAQARANEGNPGGRHVFISHSSQDKQLAVWLSVDLSAAGHVPWLDEWRIRAGDSIPAKIAHGIDECEFLLLLLSPNSVRSGWVEREWSTKYWSEVEHGKVVVIPVLLADCEIPTLLRTKKYADLRNDYRDGLDQVLDVLR